MTTINVPFVRDEWIPALRSGAYQQGRQQLRYANDAFCCLGVGGDLIVKGGYVPDLRWNIEEGGESYFLGDLHGGNCGSLPIRALTYIGLTGDREGELIRLNDDGMSFAEIADFIERVWLREEAGDEVGVAR